MAIYANCCRVGRARARALATRSPIARLHTQRHTHTRARMHILRRPWPWPRRMHTGKMCARIHEYIARARAPLCVIVLIELSHKKHAHAHLAEVPGRLFFVYFFVVVFWVCSLCRSVGAPGVMRCVSARAILSLARCPRENPNHDGDDDDASTCCCDNHSVHTFHALGPGTRTRTRAR